MSQRIRQLLSEVRRGLEDLYAGRLLGVYLFGSYARGEATPESDIDVLVVLDDVVSYCAELERSSYLVSALSLEYDVSVSIVLMSRTDWLHRDGPFHLNVREEAIAA